MNKTVATTVVGVMVTCLAGSPAGGADWSGVELAWRNDPRPAADAPLPVELPPARRTSRRAQRRIIRRGDLDPVTVEPRPAPVEPRPVPLLEEPRSVEPLLALPTEPIPPADRLQAIAHPDQAYGEHPRQRYDLFLPEGCTGGGLPLVVWIQGRDWRTGAKADCPIAWLVEQGFAVACVDYRPSDLAVFPAQLDDCRAALAALRADAETWGIDASRMCVAGMGGGGHLAALVAFAPTDPRPIHEASAEDAAAVAPADVAAVAMFDAPTHLPSLGGSHDRAGSAASRLVGGPLPEFREAAQRASPLLHVSAQAPPALIVHGGRGDGTALDQGDRLDAALRAAGVESGLVILDATASDLAPRRGSPAAGALVEFLDRTVGPTAVRHED
ncbi:MAG: alpha/beta hydrolase [Planctomycetota bacterium]